MDEQLPVTRGPEARDLRTRIAAAISAGRFDAGELELCLTDLLAKVYPGLSPIPGGTDHGRDADIHDGEEHPIRVLVTRMRDVAANVRTGLASMAEHGVVCRRAVVATSQTLSETQRLRLSGLFADAGARLVATYDSRWLTAALYEDPDWRLRLLGITGELEGLTRRPLALDRSPGGALPLAERG